MSEVVPRSPRFTAWLGAAGRSRLPVAGLVALLLGLASGALVRLWNTSMSDLLWVGTTAAGLLPLVFSVGRQLLRRSLGVDVVAILAMVGCLLLSEYLAGAVIAVMFVSGQALEVYAQQRARSELTNLVSRTPRVAYRYVDSGIAQIETAALTVGDRLLIKTGDVLPVDGVVAGTVAVLDEAALTGESRPVTHEPGDTVLSGTVNAGHGFDLIASSTASASTYGGIVRMVEAAQSSRAPLVRLADRYAFAFLVVTFALAALAWAVSGNAERALAVLVVATPCPLIIAAPVAVVSGVSRAARAGVVLKGGAVLEQLGSLKVLVFDKTGTLTSGRPSVRGVSAVNGFSEDEVLRLAASVDQISSHPLAACIRQAARARGMQIEMPADVDEQLGAGVSGVVEGRRVRIGRADFVGISPAALRWESQLRRRAILESLSVVFVAVDGFTAGAVLLGDNLRPDSARTVRALRRSGLRRIVMVTGDHHDVAEAIGAAVGLDAVMAEHDPQEKVSAVQAERASYGSVAFVGDGINDAPALASADVGVAIGARGISAASEAADAVLIVDRLDNLADAIGIAQRSRAIAIQSILVGMTLSAGGMILAALGGLVPVAGAVFQEGIDVLVILNALRALGGEHRKRPAPELSQFGAVLHAEHVSLSAGIELLRELAGGLDQMPSREARSRLKEASDFLLNRVLPHEKREEVEFYPLIARHLGGIDPTATMLRAHVEIVHLVRVFTQLVEATQRTTLESADIQELRRLLYSLHAILSLHNVQEDEAYISLIDTESHTSATLAASKPGL